MTSLLTFGRRHSRRVRRDAVNASGAFGSFGKREVHVAVALLGMLAGAACGSPDLNGVFTESGGVGGQGASSNTGGSNTGGSNTGGGGGTGAGTPTTTTSTASSATGGGGTGGTGGSGGTGGTSPTCGNTVVDSGEECDLADLGGKTCADFDFSKPQGLKCNDNCTFDTSQCKPSCDGGKKEPGETCDGKDLGGETCKSQAGSDGTLACAPNCTGFVLTGCGVPCNNGKLDAGEECDGNNLNKKTCADYQFSGGKLSCNPTTCTIDTSGCIAGCGNGKPDGNEECDDGNQEDRDLCRNDCTRQGHTCQEPISISLSPGTISIEGTTVGGGTHLSNSVGCVDPGNNSPNATGPDVVYEVEPTQSGFVTARLVPSDVIGGAKGTNYDAILYSRTSCQSDTGTLCVDRFDEAGPSTEALPGGEILSTFVQSGSSVFIFVDGYGGKAGNYQLELDLSSGNDCNDPVPFTLEDGTPMRVRARTDSYGSEANACVHQNAPDVVVAVTRPKGGPVDLHIYNSDFDAELYAEVTCGGGQLACVNNPGPNANEQASVSTSAGLPVFVWIGGANAGADGVVRMSIDPDE